MDFGVWGALPGRSEQTAETSGRRGSGAFKFFWGYAIDSKTYQLIYIMKRMKDVFRLSFTGGSI